MRHAFILFGLLFLTYQVSAQTFSNNREKFAKDLARYLSAHDAKLAKDFMKDFEPYIMDKMNQAKFNRMVETCNKIHDKKLLPIPDLYHYVRSMYAIEKDVLEFKSFQIYHDILDENLDKSNAKYAKEYLKNMHDFLNEGILHSATNFYWYCYNGEYSFSKGPNGIVLHFRDVNLTCITLGK